MKQNSDKKTRLIVYTLFGIFLGVFLAYGIMYKFPAIFQETITTHKSINSNQLLLLIIIIII